MATQRLGVGQNPTLWCLLESSPRFPTTLGTERDRVRVTEEPPWDAGWVRLLERFAYLFGRSDEQSHEPDRGAAAGYVWLMASQTVVLRRRNERLLPRPSTMLKPIAAAASRSARRHASWCGRTTSTGRSRS